MSDDFYCHGANCWLSCPVKSTIRIKSKLRLIFGRSGHHILLKSQMNPARGIAFLESRGINLFHAFDTAEISDSITKAIPSLNLDRFPTTVLIAHAGYVFWQSMRAAKIQGDHPVDQYSILLAQEYSEKYLDCKAKFLYPSDYPISLIDIGRKTGWSFTSPMGISIHPTYGSWFAYRALFLIEKSLPATQPLIAEHPCESCTDKPCQSVCPSGAVGEIGSFGLDTCARFRIQDESTCAYRCLSRLSCPVGSEYRYDPDQLKYHYNRSRTTMQQYYSSDSAKT